MPSPGLDLWFRDARYGLFIHFGPYVGLGHGVQVLFREHLDQRDYERRACAWNPQSFDAEELARQARLGGYRYAVLTARHHDGYCLWPSRFTDYSSAAQAPKRDLVREYVAAMRAAGLRVGLYYSLSDWRIPAYWSGSGRDPEGWCRFIATVHGQVEELLTHYGKIDQFWFDGAWPHSVDDWQSHRLLARMRELQPDIVINNRLGSAPATSAGSQVDGGLGAGESHELGDYGTPEQVIRPEHHRPWESCNTTIWRLWGHLRGQRWKSAAEWLDMLCSCASQRGNLLLNLGPDGTGALPSAWLEANREVGLWLERHGEAIYASEGGDLTEYLTHGWQTIRGDRLYLIHRWHDPEERELRLVGVSSPVRRVWHLSHDRELPFEQQDDVLTIRDLPREPGTSLFPVIRVECHGRPTASWRGRQRLWQGDAGVWRDWAAARGEGSMVDGGWPSDLDPQCGLPGIAAQHSNRLPRSVHCQSA